jgi:hypothetical protein
MEDDLEYWQWVVSQREEDLSLEIERGEDDELIRILKSNLEEAKTKVEELTSE